MLNGRKVDRGVRNPHNQGEDLTNLTFIKAENSQNSYFFSFTLYIYNKLYGLSLSKTILLKMAVILCILGTQRVKNEKKSHNFICT